jgi:hypothetical protein
MKLFNYALPSLALGLAAVLLVPGEESLGYSTIGGSLSAESQRDFRVRNNFADASANNNITTHPEWPGFDGAELACWKAGVEWGSMPHGNGSGDPTQSTVGNGGANFEFFWAGNAGGIGTSNNNIISAISSCGGSTLAYCETPISDGWRIRFCDNWSWHDGPGTVSGMDIQGVACHELGHSLGLGHSSNYNATMYPSISGSGVAERSINADDQAGVQAIYGTIVPAKPVITAINITGPTINITGYNFSDTGGEVWFTNTNTTSTGVDPRVRVTGVSSTGGGTQISISIPAGAGSGDVAVKKSYNGPGSLSNCFPFDGGAPVDPLEITSIVPSTIENLIPGTAETITINGTGFGASTTVELDGSPIFGSYTVHSDTLITLEWEVVGSPGGYTIGVVDGAESDTEPITVIANTTPTLQVGNGDPGNLVSGFYFYTMAGQPGTIQYLVASPSPVPSILPGKIHLDLGNAFQTYVEVDLVVIPAGGHTSKLMSTGTISNLTLYWQSLNIDLPISTGWPMEESNLQSIYIP